MVHFSVPRRRAFRSDCGSGTLHGVASRHRPGTSVDFAIQLTHWGAAEVMKQMISAIYYLHTNYICHRAGSLSGVAGSLLLGPSEGKKASGPEARELFVSYQGPTSLVFLGSHVVLDGWAARRVLRKIS